MRACITDGLPVGGPHFMRSKEEYWKMRHRWERKPFEPHWDDALKLLREHRFRTQMDFAAYFKRPPRWATAFKETVIRQHEMTLEEWKDCFSRDKRGRPTEDPRTWDEQQALSKPDTEPPALEDESSGMATPDGYVESVGAVLARLSQREFKNEDSLRRFYKCSPEKIDRLRNLVVGGDLMTDEQWQGLFTRFTRQRAVDVPEAPEEAWLRLAEVASSWADLTLEALRPLLQKKSQQMGDQHES